MANKKVKPSEDFYDFLPQRVQESTKIKTISEKNVLATLCFERLSHSIYAKEHNGWFYCSHKDIIEGCGLEAAQLKRVLTKLEMQKLIERKSGTNHRCTHYRLHPKIDELLPQTNDTVEEEENTNEPLAVKIDNEPLDKIRLDESSKDEYSLENINAYVAPLDEDATTHKNWDDVIKEWKAAIVDSRTIEQLQESKRTFFTNGKGMPIEFKEKVESVRDSYELRYALLRNKH